MTLDQDLWDRWREAAGRPEVSDRLRALLNQIDEQVSRSGFACRQSGRCCRFESFGHRLYMTGLEIAWFRSRVGEPSQPEVGGAVMLPILDTRRDGCPYQVDGACSVHPDRPFACRVFFCQEGSDAWQSERYEAFQAEMKKLHEDLGLPYRYMEWRQGLAEAHKAGV